MTNGLMRKIYRLLAFIVYLVPMLILFIARKDKYLQAENTIGFFGFLLIIFVVIFFEKQIFGDKLTGKRFIIISGILFLFSFLTQYIAEELVWITGVSTLSAILASFINEVAEVYSRYEFKEIEGVKRKNPDKALPQKEAWKEAYFL